MKSRTNFLERRKRPRVGVMAQLEDITYSILRKNGVVNGLRHKTRVIRPITQVTQRKGGETMANLAIIVSNDRPIREERFPRTWLLYKDKDTIEIQVTHDSHNRPFVRDKNVA